MTGPSPNCPTPTGPILYLRSPDNTISRIDTSELLEQDKDRLYAYLGRGPNVQIPLDDPQQNISRIHCCIEYQSSQWYARDPGSSNGTYLKRAKDHSQANTLPLDLRTCDREPLQDQDTLLILALLQPHPDCPDDPELYPSFYEITFQDPHKTRPRAKFSAPITGAEYHLSSRALYLLRRDERLSVNLAPQEQRFLHCIAQYHQDQGSEQVCPYEYLIAALWGSNAIGATANQVQHLAWRIKAKIEVDSGEPRFLHNIRGQGYRLTVAFLP